MNEDQKTETNVQESADPGDQGHVEVPARTHADQLGLRPEACGITVTLPAETWDTIMKSLTLSVDTFRAQPRCRCWVDKNGHQNCEHNQETGAVLLELCHALAHCLSQGIPAPDGCPVVMVKQGAFPAPTSGKVQ